MFRSCRWSALPGRARAADGVGLEDLSQEALERQAEGKDAISAVVTLIFLRQQVRRVDSLQDMLELGQGGLANLLGGASAASRQTGPKGREEPPGVSHCRPKF